MKFYFNKNLIIEDNTNFYFIRKTMTNSLTKIDKKVSKRMTFNWNIPPIYCESNGKYNMN